MTPSGLVLPKTGAFQVDYDAMERVLKRVTKGLFFLNTGSTLPHTHDVGIIFPPTIPHMPEEQIDAIKELLEEFREARGVIVGRNVFRYKVLFNPRNRNESFWFFLFYERLWFLSFTLPREVDGS